MRLGEIISNERIAPQVARLRFRFAPPPAAAPGQFLHLFCDAAPADSKTRAPGAAAPFGTGLLDDVAGLLPHEGTEPGSWRPEGHEFRDPVPLLRRPFSISRIYPDGLEVIVQILPSGLGTPRLAALAPGQTVNCLGPLGRGFAFKPDLRHALLVGGGVGITPMIATGEHLRAQGVPCQAIAAGRTRSLIALELAGEGAGTRALDFERVGVSVDFATDDGTLGHRGLVIKPLAEHLAAMRDVPGVEVFACGPYPMLRAVAAVAAEWDRPCQVLMEEVMGCGIGVCLACVTKVRAEDAPGYRYARICTEGPAFDAREVVWE